MIPSDFRLCRILPLLSLTALLAGCATQPTPLPPPPPTLTASDLSNAAHTAYREGFEAGRHYQYRVDMRRPGSLSASAMGEKAPEMTDDKAPPMPNPSPPSPDSTMDLNQASLPAAATAPAAKSSTTATPPQPQPAPLPPLPPSASYTTSGPAQPLQ
ncbi:MAG: hypothetical protein KGQ79_06180 [Proteobacteria bacterium]|nr:hypothetical protein [Pseudomonadota bacterium]MBU6425111.1 hypothetical protein [Rhodospirillales bacterium]